MVLFAGSARRQTKAQDPDTAETDEKALKPVARAFRAKLENGVWTAAGTRHRKDREGQPAERCTGGAAVARISEADRRVLSTGHTKIEAVLRQIQSSKVDLGRGAV